MGHKYDCPRCGYERCECSPKPSSTQQFRGSPKSLASMGTKKIDTRTRVTHTISTSPPVSVSIDALGVLTLLVDGVETPVEIVISVLDQLLAGREAAGFLTAVFTEPCLDAIICAERIIALASRFSLHYLEGLSTMSRDQKTVGRLMFIISDKAWGRRAAVLRKNLADLVARKEEFRKYAS